MNSEINLADFSHNTFDSRMPYEAERNYNKIEVSKINLAKERAKEMIVKNGFQDLMKEFQKFDEEDSNLSYHRKSKLAEDLKRWEYLNSQKEEEKVFQNLRNPVNF